jgi:hypothetical protein
MAATPPSAERLPGTSPAVEAVEHAPPPTEPAVDPEIVRRELNAEVRKVFGETDLPADVLALATAGRIRDLTELLEQRAESGDASANVLLARLARECAGADAEAPSETALTEKQRRAFQFAKKWRDECGQSSFDATAIQKRMRVSADNGDAESLYQLAVQTADLTARRKLLLSAAMLGNPRAQEMLAFVLRSEDAARERPRNREGADFWLTSAAQRLPAARTSLALCQLRGCNGRNADPETALSTLRETAQLGEPSAFEALARGAADLNLPLPEQLAWTGFHERLSREGCYGLREESQPDKPAENAENRLSPYELEQARALSETYWRDYADKARKAQGCL